MPNQLIREFIVTVTVSGAAGSATGNGTMESGVNGTLVAYHLSASVTPPATTDYTFTDPDSTLTLFTVTDSNAVGWRAPALTLVGLTGTAITDSHRELPIINKIKVAIAQADAGTYTFRFYIRIQ